MPNPHAKPQISRSRQDLGSGAGSKTLFPDRSPKALKQARDRLRAQKKEVADTEYRKRRARRDGTALDDLTPGQVKATVGGNVFGVNVVYVTYNAQDPALNPYQPNSVPTVANAKETKMYRSIPPELNTPWIYPVHFDDKTYYNMESLLRDYESYYTAYKQTVNSSSVTRVLQLEQEMSSLRAKISEAEFKTAMAMAALKVATQGPYLQAVIIGVSAVGEDRALIVAFGGQVMTLPVTKEAGPFQVGDCIYVSKNMAVVGTVPEQDRPSTGQVLSVSGIPGPGTVEVSTGTQSRILTCTVPAKAGDRVVTDSGGMVVLKNLGKKVDNFVAETPPDIDWDQIGGQHQAKTEMREAIEGPVLHREIFKAYGKKPVKGVLLYGPPGCGKTLLAKAAATSMARLHGKSASGTGFIYVKGPEILNKYVGESEATIRDLFARARDHFRNHGYPAVLFIDEADAVLGNRQTNNSISGMEKTIVPMFLAEMDGFDDSNPLVLLATNISNALDPAVVRDGRIDRKIEVRRPDLEDAKEILRLYLRDKPVSTDPEVLVDVMARGVYGGSLRDRSCGALLSGVVEMAVSIAMRRDLAGSGTCTGIGVDDVETAVRTVEQQNQHLR